MRASRKCLPNVSSLDGAESVQDADRRDAESLPAPETSVLPDEATRALPGAQSRAHQLADFARKHHAALVRFLTLRTGSREDAKEVAQEAYAKLLALDRPDTISFLAGYLWRVATNLAVDRKRRRDLGERFSVDTADEEHEPSSESVVDARQRLAIIDRAMRELPPKCRQAFSLRVLKGLTFEEVGREMGMSDRQAKTYVARALESLQDCLDAADRPRDAS